MLVSSGPDFLCVGMHKTGTQWLYDQLQAHPDFWMPPIKELHYLERGIYAGGNAAEIMRGERRTARHGGRKWRNLADPRDRAFIEEMAARYGQPMDIGHYGSLFRHKGPLLSGDITPQYGAVDDEIVEQVALRFPETVILLLVRDPVARAWSHISQWHRRGQFDTRVLMSRETFRAFLEQSERLQRFSSAAGVAQRWMRRVKEEKFRYFFFDDIVRSPDQVRHAILGLLGADPNKLSGDIEPGFNRKADHKKLEFTVEIESVLAEFLRDELCACASIFQGHANDWFAKYGARS